MTLEMLANNLRLFPTSTMQYTTPETLLTVLDLVAHGGFSLQASALNALAALLPEMPLELIPMQTVVSHLLHALETWAYSSSIPEDHSALGLWQQHVLTCFNLLTGMLGDSQGTAGPAESMLDALPKLVCRFNSSQSSFQARLCQVALATAEQHLDLSHHLAPVLALLAAPDDSGKASSHALYLLLQQLQTVNPQQLVFGHQVSHSEYQAQSGTPELKDAFVLLSGLLRDLTDSARLVSVHTRFIGFLLSRHDPCCQHIACSLWDLGMHYLYMSVRAKMILQACSFEYPA